MLLGPVKARTSGKAVTKRIPYFTELLTFLALRRQNGVTAAVVADTFGIEVRKARGYVQIVRDWLGRDDVTNQFHLPHAVEAPAALQSGVPVYQVDDRLLIDIDLFRRLRVRGQARGPEGMADLCLALRLVSGRPFDQLREAGWSWLVDGERLDQYMTFAVADVALTVTTDALERGKLDQARAAAEIGVTAAPYEDASRLSLIRVERAAGRLDVADGIVRNEVCNRSDDGDAPDELPTRSAKIIRSQEWLADDSAAT